MNCKRASAACSKGSASSPAGSTPATGTSPGNTRPEIGTSTKSEMTLTAFTCPPVMSPWGHTNHDEGNEKWTPSLLSTFTTQCRNCWGSARRRSSNLRLVRAVVGLDILRRISRKHGTALRRRHNLRTRTAASGTQPTARALTLTIAYSAAGEVTLV